MTLCCTIESDCTSLIQLLANIITIISFAWIYYTFSHAKKQIYFNAMSKCTEHFRKITESGIKEKVDFAKYIDLVNEELFYFQNGYIPKIVAIEWIDGMIDFLPFFNSQGEIINTDFELKRFINKEAIKKEVFKSNPRIKKFLCLNNTTFRGTLEEYNKNQKKKLLREICKNFELIKFWNFGAKNFIRKIY